MYISSTYGDYEGLKKKYKKFKIYQQINQIIIIDAKELMSFFKPIRKNFKVLDIGSGLSVFPKKLKAKNFLILL